MVSNTLTRQGPSRPSHSRKRAASIADYTSRRYSKRDQRPLRADRRLDDVVARGEGREHGFGRVPARAVSTSSGSPSSPGTASGLPIRSNSRAAIGSDEATGRCTIKRSARRKRRSAVGASRFPVVGPRLLNCVPAAAVDAGMKRRVTSDAGMPAPTASREAGSGSHPDREQPGSTTNRTA